MMLQGMTARYLLKGCYDVKKGDVILIHAAAGGVGSIVCQWANFLGATVIGTVGSPEKAEIARLNGCDHPILYNEEDFAAKAQEITAGKGVDVVYDTVGGDVQTQSYQVLKQGGFLVSIVAMPDEDEAKQYGVQPGFVFVQPNGEQLREIARLVETGRVKPASYETMRFEDAALAQEQNKAGHVRGKIVLAIK